VEEDSEVNIQDFNDVSKNDLEVDNQDDDEGSEKAKIVDPTHKEDLSYDEGLGSDVSTSDLSMEKNDEMNFKPKNENPSSSNNVLVFADANCKSDEVKDEKNHDLDSAHPDIKSVQDLCNFENDLSDRTIDDPNSCNSTRNDGELENDHGSVDNMVVKQSHANTEIRDHARDCTLNYVEIDQAGKYEDFEIPLDYLSDIATLNILNTSKNNPLYQDFPDQTPVSNPGKKDVDKSENVKAEENAANDQKPRAHSDFITVIENGNAHYSLNLNNLDDDRNFESIDTFELSHGDIMDENQACGNIFYLVDTANPNCFVERLNSTYATVDHLLYQSPSSLDTLEIKDLFFGYNASDEDHPEGSDETNDRESLEEFVEADSLSGDQDLDDPRDLGENQNCFDAASPEKSVSGDSTLGDQNQNDSELGENQNEVDAVSEEPLSAEEERAKLRALNLILKFNRKTGYV
jgi:hypothetical protein